MSDFIFKRLLVPLLLLFSFSSNLWAVTPTIVVLGDSLSAAFGIEQDAGWVSLLQRRLDNEGFNYEVINVSISGETTAGGLSRSENIFTKYHPEILILELGANDGLRGLSLTLMRSNLSQIIALAKSTNTKVLLIGMRLPPNYGSGYTQQFHQAFIDLAAQQQTLLLPFLFDGLADDSRYFQQDALHPTAAAQPILLNSVWTSLRPLLDTNK